ncbi:zinc-ribbon domain-containing protein [Aceticella autotrophica]|uniref:Zinc-ribbon domain-containing protein n=1 Tax=Aceticella autotrophica TaxID=2755338 RepID=A0A975G987_9THEO|nr:zinc-ribbon domain-containing protein [Aceticella autotrophica]QSZ26709.1 zinc-ribbon domain-containing protein [Aceticella autotrophica]
MYCLKCGHEINEDEKFCSFCGTPVDGNSSNLKAVPKVKTNYVIKIDKKFLYIIPVVLVLIVAYFITKSFYGPYTPEILQEKFSKALATHDVATILSLIDNNELSNKNSVEAFVNNMDDNTISQYVSAINSNVQELKYNNNTSYTNASNNFLYLIKKRTFFGDVWKVHINPVTIKTQPIPMDNISFNIGKLKSNNGAITNLFPSSYKVDLAISNDFTKADIKTDIEIEDILYNSQKAYTYIYSIDLKNLYNGKKLVLENPDNVSDLSIKLNGKQVGLNRNANTEIYPVPESLDLEVNATVLGVHISEKGKIDTSMDNNWVSEFIKRGVAKHALNILYNASVSWTKANNDGNPSELTDANPNGQYYTDAASHIESAPVKTQFIKVIVDPKSVRIDSDALYINDTEYYNDKNGQNIANWTYKLQQIPNKQEWWILEDSSSFEKLNDNTGEFTKSAV